MTTAEPRSIESPLESLGRSARGLAAAILPAAIVLAWFAPALFARKRFAFRDVGHFYTPLYDYLARRSEGGRLPLWNPLDQTGIPIIGESTTALFYPIRAVLYALPTDGDTAMTWYVLIHLVLAAYAARFAALRFGCDCVAASGVAIVYVASGSVLFLGCNPPFLVGAAWLPIALTGMLPGPSVDSGSTSRNRRLIATGSAVALAMMVLGGDPQSALHAALVATAAWCILSIRQRRVGWNGFAVQVVLPCTLAAVLTAPQLAGSLSWASQSTRTRTDVSGATTWWRPGSATSRKHDVYQFSLPPWHVAELVTPMPAGSLLPVYHRLSRIVPGDGRVWTPTIYMGAISFLALIVGRPRRRSDEASTGGRVGSMWWWIAVFSLTACFGWFGVTWLIQNATGTLAGVDSAIGGTYWWLYQFIPGYDAFRYPVKWLPVFALATAMHTGLVLTRWDAERSRRFGRAAAVFAVVCIVSATIGWLTFDSLRQIIAAKTGDLRDPFWGPLQPAGALAEVLRSLVHSACVFTAIFGLLKIGGLRISRSGRTAAVPSCLVLLTIVELVYAQHDLLPQIDRSAESAALARLPDTPKGHRWLRTRSGDGWPTAWSETSSRDRLLDVEVRSRADWFGRWHLVDDAVVFNSMTSIRSRAVADFWRQSKRRLRDATDQEKRDAWAAVRRRLAIDGVLRQNGADPAERRIDTSIESPIRFEADGDERAGADIGVLRRTPEYLRVRVRNDRPGLLHRPVFQDGHWTASLRSAGAAKDQIVDVRVVESLKQGVRVSAGEHVIEFRYRPIWLLPGLIVGLLGWSFTGVGLVVFWRRSHPAGGHRVGNQDDRGTAEGTQRDAESG